MVAKTSPNWERPKFNWLHSFSCDKQKTAWLNKLSLFSNRFQLIAEIINRNGWPCIQRQNIEECYAILRSPHLFRVLNVSYRVFNCILVHFIPLPVFIFYSFTGIYILLILFLYSLVSTLFPCTLYGLIFPFLFLYFYSIFVYSFSLFSVPAWMGLYRRGWDYTAWSVFV